MDPFTHTLAGISIGLVASQLPGLKENPNLTIAIAVGSSVIPDIDVVTKLFKNKNYISYHRSGTHSIIGLPILGLIPPLILFWFFRESSFYQLYILSLISIFFHVFLDILNPYGTKLIPKRSFVGYGIIYTFDPIFISLLLTGVFSFRISIYLLYATIIVMLFYFYIRFHACRLIKKKLQKIYPTALSFHILSRIIPYDWNIIIEFHDSFIIANYRRKLYDISYEKKTDVPAKYKPLISFLKEYKAFYKLSYSSIVKVNETNDFAEISLLDLKYRKHGFYYFRAIFRVKDNKIINSYIGWVFSEKGFTHKVDMSHVKGEKNEIRRNKK